LDGSPDERATDSRSPGESRDPPVSQLERARWVPAFAGTAIYRGAQETERKGRTRDRAMLTSLVPMIRVAGEDLLRAVQLFEQHAAHHQMRPGHRAERDGRVGAGKDRLAESVGAADREGERGCAPVAPAGEPVGEVAAGPGAAALVERNQPGAGRHRAEDQFGLARLQRRWRQPALFLEFGDGDRRD